MVEKSRAEKLYFENLPKYAKPTHGLWEYVRPTLTEGDYLCPKPRLPPREPILVGASFTEVMAYYTKKVHYEHKYGY